MAAMRRSPAASALVWSDAPPLSSSGMVPKLAPDLVSTKVTPPVTGGAPASAVTVAVNVISSPTSDGLGLLVSMVVVLNVSV